MASTTSRRRGAAAISSDARSLRLRLAQLDQDQADLERARQLWAQGRELSEVAPREAFELVHRAALRGAGVLVARANRARRRALPLNVWAAMERMGGEDAERAERLAPLVAERTRLDRDGSALPDPALLERHLEETSAHLARISQRLLEDLPGHAADLATAG